MVLSFGWGSGCTLPLGAKECLVFIDVFFIVTKFLQVLTNELLGVGGGEVVGMIGFGHGQYFSWGVN
jgi:hypothetical protein